jgi:hypothetical protein
MLHSPLFLVWIGWVLGGGVIAVVREVYSRRENAERDRRREKRASRQVRRTSHPIRYPQREPILHLQPPGERQHLIDVGIIKPAGDPS